MSIANPNNSAVKRILKEFQELKDDLNSDYKAAPLEDNIFEWHFTIRGPSESDFNGGIYHGRIILPPDYPFKPPNIVLLTPNGRFQVDVKICLTISAHHPEHWQPSWSIRTVLVALIGFMPTEGKGAIGSLDYTPEERKNLAEKSLDWKCSRCGCHNKVALPASNSDTNTTTTTTTTTTTNTNTNIDTSNIDKTTEKTTEIIEETQTFTTKNDENIENIEQLDPFLNGTNDNKDEGDITSSLRFRGTKVNDENGNNNSATINLDARTTTTTATTTSTSTTTTTTTTSISNDTVNRLSRNISLTNPSTSIIDGCIIVLFICVLILILKKFFF